MTLHEFTEALTAHAPNAPLVFSTAEGPINPGYHVTEFRRADIQIVDCGGRTGAETRAEMQLMDGGFGDHMQVGKLSDILARSLAALPGLRDAPLVVEFGQDHNGLALFDAAAPVAEAGDVHVALAPRKAVCRAAQRPDCCG